MVGCAFQKEGLVFNEKEEPQKLSINKLREIDLKMDRIRSLKTSDVNTEDIDTYFAIDLTFLIIYILIFAFMLIMTTKSLTEPLNRTFTNILTILFVALTFSSKDPNVNVIS